MKLNVMSKLPAKMQGTLSRTGLKIKKYTPEIAFVVGVGFGMAAIVSAWKTGVHAEDVISEHDERINNIHRAKKAAEEDNNVEYSKKQYQRDLIMGYAKSFGSFGRVYGPSVGLWFASMTCFGVSFGVLKKRNVGLALAYNTLEAGYSAYRGRVIKEFGEEVDQRMRFGLHDEEFEEVVVDDKGKEKTKKVTKTVADDISDYAILFNRMNCPSHWQNDPAYNLMFLKNTQNYANDILNNRGHLFLNEVYDMLGADRTPEGQVVGWFRDPRDPKRDNFVDFGFMQDVLYDDKGLDRDGILLDFNVDGPILELI